MKSKNQLALYVLVFVFSFYPSQEKAYIVIHSGGETSVAQNNKKELFKKSTGRRQNSELTFTCATSELAVTVDIFLAVDDQMFPFPYDILINCLPDTYSMFHSPSSAHVVCFIYCKIASFCSILILVCIYICWFFPWKRLWAIFRICRK